MIVQYDVKNSKVVGTFNLNAHEPPGGPDQDQDDILAEVNKQILELGSVEVPSSSAIPRDPSVDDAQNGNGGFLLEDVNRESSFNVLEQDGFNGSVLTLPVQEGATTIPENVTLSFSLGEEDSWTPDQTPAISNKQLVVPMEQSQGHRVGNGEILEGVPLNAFDPLNAPKVGETPELELMGLLDGVNVVGAEIPQVGQDRAV